MAVLSVVESEIAKNSAEQNIIPFVCLLAQRLILLNWKWKAAPTYINLIRDITKHLELEKIKSFFKKRKKK